MRAFLLALFFCFAHIVSAQEILGELSQAEMHKIGDHFYVFGLKDKTVFKVIKYGLNLNVVTEYEKTLGDEARRIKFIDLRGKLEFCIYYNMKLTRGIWIKLDTALNVLDDTPFGEEEAKSAFKNKLPENKENYTPFIHADAWNYFNPNLSIKNNSFMYQDGEYLYNFQHGSEDAPFMMEKGLFNKDNGALRKYKISSDKGFPVMKMEWELILPPYVLPVEIIPTLCTADQLAFMRCYREMIYVDKKTGTITKRVKPQLNYSGEANDSIYYPGVCTKYIPEKEVFISCGMIIHENKGLKKALDGDSEFKKYFIYVSDKNGIIKTKIVGPFPEHEKIKSEISAKRRMINFSRESITYANGRIVIYGINGGGQTWSSSTTSNSPSSSGNYNTSTSSGVSYVMTGISVHTLDDDLNQEVSFVLDPFFNSKKSSSATVYIDDLLVTESGNGMILLRDPDVEAAFNAKTFQVNFGRTGSFVPLKMDLSSTYFVKDLYSVYLFDKSGSKGKYKITTLKP